MIDRVQTKDKQNYLKEAGGFFSLIPFFMISACFVLLFFKNTRNTMLWLLEENHPVEILTFVLFALGALLGIRLVIEEIRRGFSWSSILFHVGFSMLLLLIAMEEISWGQQFFGFETPPEMQAINRQGELNLHNMSGLQGRSEWFRLIFGLGGLFGVVCSRWKRFASVSVPLFLFAWFGVISAHAMYDVLDDFIKTPARISYAVQRTSEFVEMMIAMSSMLYLGAKFKKTRSE